MVHWIGSEASLISFFLLTVNLAQTISAEFRHFLEKHRPRSLTKVLQELQQLPREHVISSGVQGRAEEVSCSRGEVSSLKAVEVRVRGRGQREWQEQLCTSKHRFPLTFNLSGFPLSFNSGITNRDTIQEAGLQFYFSKPPKITNRKDTLSDPRESSHITTHIVY